MTNDSKQITVTLIKSLAGRKASHQACVRGLGLRRMHQRVTIPATPENMGMVNRARYLLAVEEQA